MSVMTSVIPHGRPFTVDDLEAMPDDGNRYELIDGTLLVSPAPNWAHQEMGASLYVLLRGHCPRDLRVLIAPFAVRTASDSEVQPDVLVARYTDLTLKNLPVAPLLAVEVLPRSAGGLRERGGRLRAGRAGAGRRAVRGARAVPGDGRPGPAAGRAAARVAARRCRGARARAGPAA